MKSSTESTRALSTVLSKGTVEDNSWAWMAAGAAVVGVASGSAAWAFCETSPDQLERIKLQRKLTKSGIRDPNTSYAQYALERQMKKETKKKETAERETDGDESTLQATSPGEAPKVVDMSATVAADPGLTPSEERIERATRKAKQHSGGLKVFSGNGNMALSLEIARHLGINLGKATVGRFADGEVNCVIHENVRGKDVYIVQPTCPPVNDNIMELLLMVSTLRRASARRITVVIPYYGYARQDRKMQVSSCHVEYQPFSCHPCANDVFLFLGTSPHFCRRRCSTHGVDGSRSRHCC